MSQPRQHGSSLALPSRQLRSCPHRVCRRQRLSKDQLISKAHSFDHASLRVCNNIRAGSWITWPRKRIEIWALVTRMHSSIMSWCYRSLIRSTCPRWWKCMQQLRETSTRMRSASQGDSASDPWVARSSNTNSWKYSDQLTRWRCTI